MSTADAALPVAEDPWRLPAGAAGSLVSVERMEAGVAAGLVAAPRCGRAASRWTLRRAGASASALGSRAGRGANLTRIFCGATGGDIIYPWAAHGGAHLLYTTADPSGCRGAQAAPWQSPAAQFQDFLDFRTPGSDATDQPEDPGRLSPTRTVSPHAKRRRPISRPQLYEWVFCMAE